MKTNRIIPINKNIQENIKPIISTITIVNKGKTISIDNCWASLAALTLVDNQTIADTEENTIKGATTPKRIMNRKSGSKINPSFL